MWKDLDLSWQWSENLFSSIGGLQGMWPVRNTGRVEAIIASWCVTPCSWWRDSSVLQEVVAFIFRVFCSGPTNIKSWNDPLSWCDFYGRHLCASLPLHLDTCPYKEQTECGQSLQSALRVERFHLDGNGRAAPIMRHWPKRWNVGGCFKLF
jgi:hypothetical protein